MIMVKQTGRNRYKVTMDKPDGRVIQTVADHFSISLDAALTSLIYRGIDSIQAQMKIQKEEETESHGCPHSGG